ncbi:Ca-activated chloride channel family protein [Marivirga sericea]|uniref:Ca-activated chloride channel family protein n=1 Tax=Marivirga sericea TaxID=1028 RepID=A0A1X7KBW3_9BACT|nr:VWA domain-containing protein [Marivirga sericea]SMG38379.1 Ca-activated chloride channel family protein [Marivirga sericea]
MKEKIIISLVFILFVLQSAKSQRVEQSIPEKTRILFLFDASGSMLAPWGNELRIDAAKRVLTNLVDSLRVNNKIELALRPYGHLTPAKERNCQDTKLEIPFAPKNNDRIIDRLKYIYPKGTTPIAYSLEQSANDFPKDDSYRNIIIIITDGIESCDGNPCAVSLELQKKDIFLRPFVIGLGMEEKFASEFDCMGEYYNAKNISAFQSVLNGILSQSLSKTTASVELLDQLGKPVEKDVNVSFINTFTGISEFDFIHFRDRNGKPDTVEVDPVLSYDVVVNTLPPVVKRNVSLKGGTHNIIKIKTPQGSLQINQDNTTEYESDVRVLVKKATESAIINTQTIRSEEKYLIGKYDLEILTLPKIEIDGVEVKQGRSQTIEIPAPGRINISYSSRGIGSLYSIDDNGRQTWIKKLDLKGGKSSFGIQPGKYKYVFRSDQAMGSKYTQIKEFNIQSGQTLNLKIY